MDKASFYEQVYQVVALIPKGKVTSYGAIAAYLGAKSSSRLVGYAMNDVNKYKLNDVNKYKLEVPAHRVVNRNGLLTGKFHFETPNAMQNALENEGLTIIEDQIQNFKQNYWDPNLEVDLEK
jgi:methylated-DNA-protein-cysteine methyltransferase-like protein